LKKPVGFPTENFKTGGSTTVRGFDQGSSQSLDTTKSDSARLPSDSTRSYDSHGIQVHVDGVTFIDAGNVYPRLQDFLHLTSELLTVSAARRAPYLLLRFDYGIKIQAEPGVKKQIDGIR
jgi:outer membrane protein assembly factor BamA